MISLKSDEITNDLIRQILSGELAISSNLPSENQLAIKYKCNRHTIRKVINHLIIDYLYPRYLIYMIQIPF